MKRIGKLKHRVTALLMSFLITSGLITPTFTIEVKAEALPSVLENSSTIADCVMTYYAMSGSAMANTEWISTLYSSLGSSFGTLGELAEDGLMFFENGVWKPAEQLVTNIESTSAYTQLGLDTVFNVTAEEAQAGGGLMAATGGTTLAGAAGCVATHGVLPVLGGVTAAYWGGIAIGTLIAHKLGLYGKAVDNGVEVTKEEMLSKIPDGKNGVIFRQFNQYLVISATGKVYGVKFLRNGNYAFRYLIYGNGNNFFPLTIYNSSNNTEGTQTALSENNVFVSSGLGAGSEQNLSITNSLTFNSEQEYLDYVSNLRANNSEPPIIKSPDLIGEKGNLTGGYNGNQYTIPDMKPQIDPQTQSGKPLSLEDWLAFANGAQNNNNSTSPIPNNTSLFQDIINAIKSAIPEGGGDPNPNPNPGGETYPVPGPLPNPTPVPDNDYQPETKPQPDYTEKATENETDIIEGDPYTTPDLLDRFPFCIPRDIYRVFTKLDSGARSAPHIQWRFHPNDKIDYTFDVDFAEWDSIAVLLRTLELLGFIVALAVATRKLILG